ncbi:hypothetical protein [Paenibacillus caui]|uniref:hypothetical protein n=1 Tax=Paenibacillus caui TaxID=2873927 RepID=UPI001CA89E07|nr:hypothetical protein [Paenibacillus caui]
MRLIGLLFIIVLTACSNTLDNSTEYKNIQELNDLPIPSSATEVDKKSTEDLKNYEIPQTFENFNVSYQEKLKDEGWKITEVESNKVISVEKNNTKQCFRGPISR